MGHRRKVRRLKKQARIGKFFGEKQYWLNEQEINDLNEKITANPIMMSEGENQSCVSDDNFTDTNNSSQISAILLMRLFGYLGRLFSNKLEVNKNNQTQIIDKKQYRQIEEKKMAQGLRS